MVDKTAGVGGGKASEELHRTDIRWFKGQEGMHVEPPMSPDQAQGWCVLEVCIRSLLLYMIVSREAWYMVQ